MMFVKQEPAMAMMFSLYVTLGIFLLLASRNPSANRSLIAFTAWSSFVHAMLMAGQAFARLIARGELIGSAVLVVIGIALIAWLRRRSQSSNLLLSRHKTATLGNAGIRQNLRVEYEATITPTCFDRIAFRAES
jgi:hypothetical protein